MKMQFFIIPSHHPDVASEELNGFLTSHRIVSVQREFICRGSESAWAICVEYLEPGKNISSEVNRQRIDYREVLSPEDFAVYSKLRELRKQLAVEEKHPPYTVFTNEQMADMVRQRAVSIKMLSEIKGIGASRLEKYGEAFLSVLKQCFVTQPLLSTESDEA